MKKNVLILGGLAAFAFIAVTVFTDFGPLSKASLQSFWNKNSTISNQNRTPKNGKSGGNNDVPPPVTLINFSLAPNVSNSKFTPGTNDASIFGFKITNPTAQDIKLMQVNLHGYVDCDTQGIFSSTFNASIANNCPSETADTSITGLVTNVRFYSNGSFVSLGHLLVNGGIPEAIFGSLGFVIPAGTSQTFVIKGDILPTTPFGALNDRFKFGFEGKEKVTLVDAATNVPIDPNLIDLNDNAGGPHNDEINDSGVIMTVGL